MTPLGLMFFGGGPCRASSPEYPLRGLFYRGGIISKIFESLRTPPFLPGYGGESPTQTLRGHYPPSPNGVKLGTPGGPSDPFLTLNRVFLYRGGLFRKFLNFNRFQYKSVPRGGDSSTRSLARGVPIKKEHLRGAIIDSIGVTATTSG